MPITRIDDTRLDALRGEARDRDRLRANDNLHPELTDPVQRMLNAFEPGTYVRPHRHGSPPKWELFLALSGAAACLTFDDSGMVTERCEIRAGGPLYGAEIPAGTWHSLAALAPGTVLFEIKPGPYAPLTDKDFADWAPEEGGAEAAALEAWMRGAEEGERWSR
ncbi:WbuC family cupin fold metalloprotein [Thiohalorhabdus methylotrophus]|uniref:WbuC family cupin fold metalloprotein n=1 Tax=Thiohalorhabdus methylotrophus TaxID=3242694 RepID=A0ABV4TTQ6_9GAMM